MSSLPPDTSVFGSNNVGAGFNTGGTYFGNQWSTDGYGNAIQNGQYTGQNAYDASVDRYHQMAAGAGAQAPVTLDQGQSDQSRGLQMDALGMLRNQATGAAPSAAAIVSQRANEGAANAAARSGVAGHGMGARIASMGATMPAVAQQATTANATNAGNRSAETQAGASAYATGAGQVNAQDVGAATQNAQLDAQQRALAQQREEYFNQMAADTRTAQGQNQDTKNAQIDQMHATGAANAAADDAAEYGAAKQGASMGISALMGLSDPRSKQNIRPLSMGSLAHLRSGGR